MSMFEGNFCCEKMKTMIYEWDTDPYPPIIRINESCYKFASRQINYCSFCGSLITKLEVANKVEYLKNSFCCKTIERFCNIEDISDDFVEFGIFYDAFSRRYYFSTHKQFWYEEGVDQKQWDIYCCIFCGAKLPDSLLGLWLEIVTKEFGAPKLERSEKMLPFVPEEYRTDAWWKKRGL